MLDVQLPGASDCGPASAAMAVAFGSCGVHLPSKDHIRTQIGHPGATSLPELAAVIRSYGVMTLRAKDAPWGKADAWLASSRNIILLGIDYGTVNDLKPGLSSCRSFRGGHYVVARFTRPVRGTLRVKVYDPLADGRRPGIPSGPQLWPLWLIRTAAAAYAGQRGTWSGLIVSRPK
jgi:hypothetical protein